MGRFFNCFSSGTCPHVLRGQKEDPGFLILQNGDICAFKRKILESTKRLTEWQDWQWVTSDRFACESFSGFFLEGFHQQE